MSAGSTQEQWLRADLAAHPATCTLAYWHHPRFSSGGNGSTAATQPIWQALYDYGAEVVVNGHDHDYERFAPQTPTGALDNTNGIREFVVGTGGNSLYSWPGNPIANSELRSNVKALIRGHRQAAQLLDGRIVGALGVRPDCDFPHPAAVKSAPDLQSLQAQEEQALPDRERGKEQDAKSDFHRRTFPTICDRLHRPK